MSVDLPAPDPAWRERTLGRTADHEDALALAYCTCKVSNLALCYLELRERLSTVKAALDLKIVKYEGDMEGVDWDDFVAAEWAAGAMRQLRKELFHA